MPDTILILGPIVFRDFEIPEKINFGGAQRMAVHQLPGGARVIDALGRDDAEITFTGTFTGPDATLRARALDEMRALGTTLPLTWDVFTYSVLVKDRGGSGNLDSRISGGRVPDQASLLMNRSDDEQTTTPEPHAGFQGEGGFGRHQGRQDAG
jgi:hypothetical protein